MKNKFSDIEVLFYRLYYMSYFYEQNMLEVMSYIFISQIQCQKNSNLAKGRPNEYSVVKKVRWLRMEWRRMRIISFLWTTGSHLSFHFVFQKGSLREELPCRVLFFLLHLRGVLVSGCFYSNDQPSLSFLSINSCTLLFLPKLSPPMSTLWV